MSNPLPQNQESAVVQPSEVPNLYVMGLPNDFTTERLVAVFSQFGEVESARVMYSREVPLNPNRSFGFVLFKTTQAANDAVRQGHGIDVGGSRIQVFIARSKVNEPKSASRPNMAQQRFPLQHAPSASAQPPPPPPAYHSVLQQPQPQLLQVSPPLQALHQQGGQLPQQSGVVPLQLTSPPMMWLQQPPAGQQPQQQHFTILHSAPGSVGGQPMPLILVPMPAAAAHINPGNAMHQQQQHVPQQQQGNGAMFFGRPNEGAAAMPFFSPPNQQGGIMLQGAAGPFAQPNPYGSR